MGTLEIKHYFVWFLRSRVKFGSVQKELPKVACGYVTQSNK